MILIHTDPGFELAATVTDHTAGRTVELFQRFPTARAPRWSRKLSLTLPRGSYEALGHLFTEASHDAP
jgi:hypothetical protein